MSMLGFLPFSGNDITWPALDEVDGGVLFGPFTGTEYEGTGVNAATLLSTLGLASGNLDAQLAAIVEDTGTTLPATLTTISGYVDCLPVSWVIVPTTAEIKTAIEAAGSSLASILEDTGTTIPGTITTLQGNVTDVLADTSELQTDWANGGRLDLILDAAVAASVVAGADSVTITWNDGEGNPVPDGDVWITSDSAGTTVVAGKLRTNSNGNATFLLDASAVYYFFAQKDGQNSIRGERFVAVAD